MWLYISPFDHSVLFSVGAKLWEYCYPVTNQDPVVQGDDFFFNCV